MGRLTLTDGREIDLVNLHLLAAETDTAFWRPSCWRAHAHNRRIRRILLHYFVSARQSATATWPPVPSLIAGDFNAPANDGAIRGLAATHLDSYVTAGRGHGDTFPANFPVHRIDQVWLSPELTALAHTTVAVPGSDHLMVVVDFVIKNR
jgi:endonuclease/exonuclease/phosphatase (EEP) superfamily protein YafD